MRNRSAGICDDSLSTATSLFFFASSYDSMLIVLVSYEFVVGSKYLLKSIAFSIVFPVISLYLYRFFGELVISDNGQKY